MNIIGLKNAENLVALVDAKLIRRKSQVSKRQLAWKLLPRTEVAK